MDVLEHFSRYLVLSYHPHTVTAYRSTLQEFRDWLNRTRGKGLLQAQEEDVRAWKRHLREHRGQKPATVNRKLSALRTFFRWLHSQGYIDKPPINVEWERDARPRPKALRPEELDALVRQAEAQEDSMVRALVLLLAVTGLRVSEVLALRWEDLEFPRRRGEALWVNIRRGKKGVSHRVPVVDPRVIDALEAHRRLTAPTWERVFPMHRTTAWRAVLRCARQAGLEGVHPHRLRHTVITRLVREEGLPIAQAWAGHRNPATTLRYAQATEEELEEVARHLTLAGPGPGSAPRDS